MIACVANYCPDYGDELTKTEIEGSGRDYCSSCDRIWWRQSVPTTSVTVREDDRILLIQREAAETLAAGISWREIRSTTYPHGRRPPANSVKRRDSSLTPSS